MRWADALAAAADAARAEGHDAEVEVGDWRDPVAVLVDGDRVCLGMGASAEMREWRETFRWSAPVIDRVPWYEWPTETLAFAELCARRARRSRRPTRRAGWAAIARHMRGAFS